MYIYTIIALYQSYIFYFYTSKMAINIKVAVFLFVIMVSIRHQKAESTDQGKENASVPEIVNAFTVPAESKPTLGQIQEPSESFTQPLEAEPRHHPDHINENHDYEKAPTAHASTYDAPWPYDPSQPSINSWYGLQDYYSPDQVSNNGPYVYKTGNW